MSRRTERLNSLFRSEISNILIKHVKDPRVSGVVSITRVEITSDLSYAKVFVSVFGSDTDRQNTFKALSSATKFIQKTLLKRLTIRHIPSLSFRLDSTIEQGNEILELIDKLEIPTGESKIDAVP